MRLILMAVVLAASVQSFAQNTSEDIFSQTFENMFTSQVTYDLLDVPQEVGNPAVPLDGGLTALLLAGSAVGYRKYRSVKSKHSA
jgi:hypothetical protein